MRRIRWAASVLALGALASTAALADDVQYETKDGIRYQVTRTVQPRVLHETKLEPYQTTTVREHYTTEMQEQARTYTVPVTQQQWVPGYQRTLNPFAPPVLTYRLMPVTRLETRTEVVRVPVTKRNLIPETSTTHIPVTKQHVVQDVHEHRVAVGVVGGTNTSNIAGGSSGTPSVANRDDLGSGGASNDTGGDDSQIYRRK